MSFWRRLQPEFSPRARIHPDYIGTARVYPDFIGAGMTVIFY
jgi:hypothetical protein